MQLVLCYRLTRRRRMAHPMECTKLLELGIHVLVSQHGHGKIIVGDSNEYGDSTAFFYQKEIEDLIRSYLSSFLSLPDAHVSERWLDNYVSPLPENSGFISRLME